MKPRLDLLGYTLERIRIIYNDMYNEYSDYMNAFDDRFLTFDEFFYVFTKIDLSRVSTLTEYDDWEFGEFAEKCVFEDEEIQKLLSKYICRRAGEFYEDLPARLLIRVLCENPTAQDLPLQWYVFDHMESGWSAAEDLAPKLEENKKILIVTEGKTDTFILQTTINTFFPSISDFFYFIDMQDNYPFTGTGNLYNFASGLTKIKIQNKIIIIFDNDEAGIYSYKKCLERLDPIPSLKFYHLPDMDEFKSFLTVGPTGDVYENINGKAVSIECFLDLSYGVDRVPKVRWTVFNEKSGLYQGALIGKDDYNRIFKKSLCEEKYSKEKLLFLVNDLVQFWCNSN